MLKLIDVQHRVRHDPTPPSVTHRDDPAGRAATQLSVGLYGQQEPRRLTLDGQDVHLRHVE